MREIVIWVVICFVINSLFVLGWIGWSYYEMKSFNKFSKQKVTLIDAMFSDLRIMAYGDERTNE